MLSKYASEIIKILVHQDDKFITNAQIAKMLNISERSVSSYMNEVAQYCEERNYHLIRKRGKGRTWTGIPREKSMYWDERIQDQLYYPNIDRK